MNYTEFSKKYNPENYKEANYTIPTEAFVSLFKTHKLTKDDAYRIAGNINCVGSDAVLRHHVLNFDGESVVEYISQFKFPERVEKLHIFIVESGYVAAKSASKYTAMLHMVGLKFKLDMKILIHMKSMNRKPLPKNNYNRKSTLKKPSATLVVA